MNHKINTYIKCIAICFLLIISISATGCFQMTALLSRNYEEPAVKGVLVNDSVVNTKGLDARVYKVAGDRKIELHIFYPKGYNKNRKKPYPVTVCWGGRSLG